MHHCAIISNFDLIDFYCHHCFRALHVPERSRNKPNSIVSIGNHQADKFYLSCQLGYPLHQSNLLLAPHHPLNTVRKKAGARASVSNPWHSFQPSTLTQSPKSGECCPRGLGTQCPAAVAASVEMGYGEQDRWSGACVAQCRPTVGSLVTGHRLLHLEDLCHGRSSCVWAHSWIHAIWAVLQPERMLQPPSSACSRG